jgi:signal transduction histidine kinase
MIRRPRTALRWGSLFLAVVALATSEMVSAQGQETWHREQYMSENGLLQNRVHVMVRDRWGALLIGTEGGVVRFDGHHFKQIGIQSAEGIKPSRVLDIQPTNEGSHVIRDAGCRQFLYKDDRLLPITAEAPTRQYTSRFSGSIGSVAATVKAMDPDSSLTRKGDWPTVVRGVPLPQDRWCLRADDELLVYKDTVLVSTWPVPNGRSGHLFMQGGHVFVFGETGSVFRVSAENGEVSPVVTKGFPAAEMRNGQLAWRLFWEVQDMRATIIVADELYVLESSASGDTLSARHIPIDLPDGQKVGALIWLDGSDVLAVGTDTKGLFIFRRQRMRSLLCEGLSEGVNNAYNAQATFGSDQVISSTRGGSRLFDPAGCRTGTPFIRGFNEGAIFLDPNNRYWYGRGDTLLQYDLVLERESVLRLGLRPMCFMAEGEVVWIGTGGGVYKAEQGRITLAYPLTDGDLSSRPNDLCRTPSGEFWMATCFGVFRVTDQGGWEAVAGLERICARTLEVIDGNVFVGSYGGGAFLVKPDGRIFQLRPDEQGFLTHVHAFMPDEHGFLWMSTNQGLFRVKRSDIEAWTQDSTQRTYYAYYGKRAGISNAEFNGGCSPSYVRTPNGWASFPTMDGLVWFRPEQMPDAFPEQDIHIEAVLVNGERKEGTDLRLPWDHRDVVVALSLAYWGDPENVLLEYAFEEDGDRWIAMATGQRELRFAGLAVGDHVLRVRKVGAQVRGDGSGIELHFAVEAPLFRRPWFILLCVMGAVLAFFGALRLNASRLRRRNSQLEQKVAARTRELVDANTDLRRSLEMKEMLVSIISHDIVTPLRFIARVAGGVARRLPADSERRLSSTLSDLANSSEKLHANAQGLLQWIKRQDGRIELRPRNVVVHLLVDEVLGREQERAAENDVRLENLVPLDDTIRTDRNVLSIILNNAVGNAVTHSGAEAIVVSGETRKEGYRLFVRDNGAGMPEPVRRHVERVQAQGALGAMDHEGERDIQGLGLLIIADLMQLLGGSLIVESEEGKGTTMILDLPFDSLFDPKS